MKRTWTSILMGVAILLAVSSCASVPKGPLGPGEMRLLSLEVPDNGNLKMSVAYPLTIRFKADGRPEIRRACFNFSGDRQSCVDVEAKDVTYGHFRVPIHVPVGSKRIDCYAEYIRDGKTSRTNTITYYVIVLKKSEE